MSKSPVFIRGSTPSLKDPERDLFEFARDGIELAAEFNQPVVEKRSASSDALHRAQGISLLIGFCGLRGSEPGSTHVLVYTDTETGRSNFQTAGVPQDGTALSPFSITTFEGRRALISGKALKDPLDTRIHAKIGPTSNHHYSRVDPDLNELPTALIVSPRSTCAAGCKGCSRGATNAFSAPEKNYIENHVTTIANEYKERGWNPLDLVSVNITTGSHPSEEKEVDMLVRIMDTYREYGFANAKFMVYNYIIRSGDAMKTIKEAGAIGYIGTIETMNDELRRQHWSSIKGGQTFEDHLERYRLAKEIGFEIIETNYVVGIDPYDEMIERIALLDSEGVAVVPNILRSYNREQYDTIHPDVFKKGASYIFDAFNDCLKSYKNPTIKERAGKLSLQYLHNSGQYTHLTDFRQLPIRHT